jgi:hypothetical protein
MCASEKAQHLQGPIVRAPSHESDTDQFQVAGTFPLGKSLASLPKRIWKIAT